MISKCLSSFSSIGKLSKEESENINDDEISITYFEDEESENYFKNSEEEDDSLSNIEEKSKDGHFGRVRKNNQFIYYYI